MPAGFCFGRGGEITKSTNLYYKAPNNTPHSDWGFWFIFTLSKYRRSHEFTKSRVHHERDVYPFFDALLRLVIPSTNNNNNVVYHLFLLGWMTWFFIFIFFLFRKAVVNRDRLTIHEKRKYVNFFICYFYLANRMLCHLYYVTAAIIEIPGDTFGCVFFLLDRIIMGGGNCLRSSCWHDLNFLR